jgi:hypothetical protein
MKICNDINVDFNQIKMQKIFILLHKKSNLSLYHDL